MLSRIKRNFNNSSGTSSEYKLETKLSLSTTILSTRSTLAVFELTPDQFNESLDELIMFLAQVTIHQRLCTIGQVVRQLCDRCPSATRRSWQPSPPPWSPYWSGTALCSTPTCDSPCVALLFSSGNTWPETCASLVHLDDHV